jgi:hypothetical protein
MLNRRSYAGAAKAVMHILLHRLSSGSNLNGGTSLGEMRCARATRAKLVVDVDQSRGGRWEVGGRGEGGRGRFANDTCGEKSTQVAIT